MAGAARRYARAIFETAQAGKSVDAWSRRLQILGAAFADPDVKRLFSNPTLSREEVERAVAALPERQLGPEGLNLVRLLVETRRAADLPEIASEFEALADEAAGRVRATVTTAIDLSADDLRSLSRDLSGSLGKEVRLEAKVDPAILGGLVLKVGDRLTDASVAARLRLLRRQLTTRQTAT